MKEIKKGYHLTEEEEKIVQNPAPDGETDGLGGHKKSRKGGVAALLGLFVLMIALAWGFLHLAGGRETTPEKIPAELPETEISAEQKAVFNEKLQLTAEESAAFWPLYIRFCTDIESVGRQHLEWLAGQRSENPENLPLEEFIDSYTTDYRQFNKTVLRYSEAFAALLGEERVSAVFLLYEEWQGQKSNKKT